MNLADSRSSSNKEQMKSTRGSFFVKATGRDTKPAWTNRIVKDFYDLDYQVDRDRFNNINKFKNTGALRSEKIQNDIRKRRSRSKVGHGDSTKSKQMSRQEKALSLSMALPRPERIDIGTISNPEELKYGLSPFEYVNTIDGRIKGKSNHHLSFDKNKIQRINNEYPIHYNRHEDIDFSHVKMMRY